MQDPPLKQLKQIGPGFWQARGSFKILAGMLDLSTHMALIQLRSGKFVVIDTIKMNPDLQADIDSLTDSGIQIAAVVATHPYHTLWFRDFYKHYPSPPYFGTPRHLRIIPEIPWAGETMATKAQWQPELDMRIPDGSEYVDPQPPRSNHFCNVLVLHKASRTVFNDDTIMCFNDPGIVMRLLGFKDGMLFFHPSIKGPGLLPTQEAPQQFKAWVYRLIQDWDFDNICTAHNGNLIGGAKNALQDLIEKVSPTLDIISAKNAKKHPKKDCGDLKNDPNAPPDCG